MDFIENQSVKAEDAVYCERKLRGTAMTTCLCRIRTACVVFLREDNTKR